MEFTLYLSITGSQPNSNYLRGYSDYRTEERRNMKRKKIGTERRIILINFFNTYFYFLQRHSDVILFTLISIYITISVNFFGARLKIAHPSAVTKTISSIRTPPHPGI